MEESFKIRKGLVLGDFINATEMRVFQVLTSLANRGELEISYAQVSERCPSLSRDSVKRSVRTLRELKLLTWKTTFSEEDGFSPCQYQILDYRDWVELTGREIDNKFCEFPLEYLYSETITNSECRFLEAIYLLKIDKTYPCDLKTLAELLPFSRPTLSKLKRSLTEKKLIGD